MMESREPRICACGSHGFARLSKWHTALFDAADLPIVAGKTWTVETKSGRAYALRAFGPRKARQRVYMHREITGASPSLDVDHWNGDGTDNRRGNLRPADRSLNNANQRQKLGVSRFKGVHWHKQAGKWHAQISFRGVRKSLGVHAVEEDAARAYDRAAVEIFGEFARTNAALGIYQENVR